MCIMYVCTYYYNNIVFMVIFCKQVSRGRRRTFCGVRVILQVVWRDEITPRKGRYEVALAPLSVSVRCCYCNFLLLSDWGPLLAVFASVSCYLFFYLLILQQVCLSSWKRALCSLACEHLAIWRERAQCYAHSLFRIASQRAGTLRSESRPFLSRRF